jgi:hypothetical protein
LTHDKAPLQAPIYVQNKTKSTKETFEEKYIWLIKTYFWSKDVIIPVLAIALPGTCKSLVHQNGKVIRTTAEVDNLFSLQKHKCKCEGWVLITCMRFPTKIICSSKKGLLQTQT